MFCTCFFGYCVTRLVCLPYMSSMNFVSDYCNNIKQPVFGNLFFSSGLVCLLDILKWLASPKRLLAPGVKCKHIHWALLQKIRVFFLFCLIPCSANFNIHRKISKLLVLTECWGGHKRLTRITNKCDRQQAHKEINMIRARASGEIAKKRGGSTAISKTKCELSLSSRFQTTLTVNSSNK